uniref:RRM domain-containing protein n=1 Tax=Marmota marmota marmota TaxID=9994 RepID=A0A8C5Z9U4_MARMA
MSYSHPPPNVEGMTSLKVDNLTYRTSPNTLRRVFQKYGPVGDVYIPRDRCTKKSHGFAFVLPIFRDPRYKYFNLAKSHICYSFIAFFKSIILVSYFLRKKMSKIKQAQQKKQR